MNRLRRSLLVRLVALIAIVVSIAVVVTALAVRYVVVSTSESYYARDLRVENTITDTVAGYGAARRGWDGVEALLDQLAGIYDERIAITTLDGTVIADTSSSPLPSQAFIVVPAVEELGDIGGFLGTDAGCLAQQGVSYEVVSDEFGLITQLARPLNADELDIYDECLNTLWKGELLAPAPDEVRLYIGERGDSAAPLFTSVGSLRLWWPVAAVFVLSLATGALVARQLVKRLRVLTRATEQMADGDLTTRVGDIGDDEVGELAQAFDAMAASLDRAEAARRQLTSDISHELRSPIHNLRSHLEAIEDGVIEPSPEVVASLRAEAIQLHHLVDDLQQLAAADAGEDHYDLVEINLAELIDTAVASHRASAQLSGVELAISVPQECRAVVDPRRIRQVVTNLVDNAVRHSSRGDSVEVTLALDGTDAVITVADTGEGIPSADLDRIFERMYRVDASRTRATGGSGLGLAIVSKIVEAHQGTVSVESTLGVGSTFTVRLPRRRPADKSES